MSRPSRPSPAGRRPRLLNFAAAERSGSTALEFSLIVGPFLMMVLFICQVGLYYVGVQALEAAGGAASRRIMTGTLPVGSQALAGFRQNEICPRLLLALDCNRVIVNAYKVDAQSDADAKTGIYQFIDASAKKLQGPPSQSAFCVGGPGDYVLLDISYAFPNVLGSLMKVAGVSSNTFMLRSTSFFRNEAFGEGGASC